MILPYFVRWSSIKLYFLFEIQNYLFWLLIIIILSIYSLNSAMSELKNSNISLKNKKIKKSHPTQLQKESKIKKIPQSQIQNDKRFSKATYDPKFLTAGSKVTKVKIDKRFSKMLKDPSFKSNSKIDRYGRTVNEEDQNKQLNEYYYMENEQEDNSEIGNQQGDEAEEIEAKQENNEAEEQNDGIRKWMENYDEKSSSQMQDIDLDDVQDIDQVWSQNSEHVIKGVNVNATNRLALCNYDWMHINAKDLMLLFNSFKTKSGYIRSIKVYMSNIGKQKLQEQQLNGPQGIWKEEQQIQEEQTKKKKQKKSMKQLLREQQQEHNSYNDDKLRRYEKERLKYYYAVIECDNKATADQIYRECDGNQFENSNLQFDLRFIPEQIQFDSSMLKQQCNDIPMSGEVKNFVSRAMGHSKVSLTWQDPELSVAASLKKINWNKLSQEELQKIDWNMYLNEDEIKEEDQMQKIVSQQKKQEEVISDWKKLSSKKYRKNDDLEITFEGGFDTKPKNKAKVEDEEIPSLNKQKKSMKQRRRQHQQQKQKRRDQLELLVDENNKEQFNFNPQDDRFNAVFSNPSFAIDPVDSRFDHRRSGQMFAEVVKRNKNKNRE